MQFTCTAVPGRRIDYDEKIKIIKNKFAIKEYKISSASLSTGTIVTIFALYYNLQL